VAERIERPERILRYEPDPPAAQRPGPVRLGVDDGLTLERDRAAQDPAARSQEPCYGETEGGLPAAGFADETDDLARRDL
jgi:hypothetical protein